MTRGTLLDPAGRPIGWTNRDQPSVHQCKTGCRLHLPCCDTDQRRLLDPWAPAEHDPDCKLRS
jgi:hypothetical protein